MSKTIAALMLMLAISPLYGELKDHFKPALGKTEASPVRNIDFIYMINLDRRPEKFAYCLDQLAPYGIVPYRFSAVNGWELSTESLDDIGVKYEPWMENIYSTRFGWDGRREDGWMEEGKKIYFSHGMTRGAVGIVLSHLSILYDAYHAGYETIWVMEDDVQVIRDPHLISDLIDSLDSLVGADGWDILFTDRDTKGQDGNYVICRSFAPRPNFTPEEDLLYYAQEPLAVSPEFNKVFARYGAYSMVIRRSGMKKLLEFFDAYKVYLPYDMDFYLPEEIKLYCVREDVVSTKPDALSDNGKPNYATDELGELYADKEASD